ncbi:uncharacterized protein K460DRAFT_411672 [Cucurbitaria berberidis CBS 394.84]|uniref:BTB domain-containing protein n=1 Tax=Cucurbitaria berberidis CBS 394.84 TaxID=1168544 RepID=A0A9P4GR79_9PLEO|nr:uncharacterized protein K460DRAFT_411672 [Cucurbitaria berberidis CBS 394.84]KAF1849865.1 hypothetical protein K460DRAFT_411672 [Cucurbitaria berberidis CBS 394.84]
MPQSKPPTLGTAVTKDVVVIEVGPERKKYYLHKALLVHHSDYFRKALEGPWTEAQEGVIKLEDIEPAVVNWFVHWLYTGTLPGYRDFKEENRIFDSPIEGHMAKLKSYAFAERFLVPEFRKAVNENLVDDISKEGYYIEVHQMLELVQEAFTTIPLDRPILQLLVDVHCSLWTQCCEDDTISVNKLPRAFLVRAMRTLHEELRWERESADEKKVYCYYEHASDEEQKACPNQHMKYDAERDFGFFEERVTCYNCSGYEDSNSED